MELNSKRILYLDYARSIALFLVVFAHLYSVDSDVKLYVYAFHMPFFFLVSGILHKDARHVPLIEKMARRMLVPFCFFLFIGYLYCAISSKSLAFGTVRGSIAGIVLGKDITANDVLWFLLAMFWVRLMGNWFIRYPKIAFSILVLVSGITYGFHVNYLYISTSLMALPFYLVGHYARIGIQKMTVARWSVLLSILFICISVLISNYNGKVSMMGCSFGSFPVIPLRCLLFYANGLIGSIAILTLVGGIKMKVFWLQKPSKCAVSIVGLQFIPVMIWYRSVGFNQNYFISFAFSVLILLGCISFHCYVEKHANWLLGSK